MGKQPFVSEHLHFRVGEPTQICAPSAVRPGLQCASPQESPWWRERVALQGGEGIAQEDSKHSGSTSTQTVTSDDQFVLLQTQEYVLTHAWITHGSSLCKAQVIS